MAAASDSAAGLHALLRRLLIMGSGSPPHVLLLTPGFPADEGDTACVPALQLFVREAAMRGEARFTVVPLHYPVSRRSYLWHGVPVHPIGGGNRRGVGRTGIWVRAAAAAVRRHLGAPLDLVHGAWLTDASALALRLGPLLRRPVVLTAMGRDAGGGTPWTEVLSLDRATVVAPCRRAADSLRVSTGRVADRIVPWGVETPLVDPAGWEERDVDVLGVGSLEAVKDWESFLRIVAELVARGSCRRVVLVGGGGERARLEALSADLGLGDRVALVGPRPRQDVLCWMGRSRVLLHTARFEGLGLVMPEALAHGATVVSTPVGVAEASDRWLVADDAAGLAAAAAEVLSSPRDTSSIRPWPLEGTVRAYGDLYRQLTGGAG